MPVATVYMLRRKSNDPTIARAAPMGGCAVMLRCNLCSLGFTWRLRAGSVILSAHEWLPKTVFVFDKLGERIDGGDDHRYNAQIANLVQRLNGLMGNLGAA